MIDQIHNILLFIVNLCQLKEQNIPNISLIPEGLNFEKMMINTGVQKITQILKHLLYPLFLEAHKFYFEGSMT